MDTRRTTARHAQTLATGSAATLPTRVRLGLTALVTVALMALAAGAADAAERGAESLDPARFAADAVALHDDGWALVDMAQRYDDEGVVELSITLGKEQRATKLTIELTDWGQHVLAYRRERAVLPGEARVYPDEAALFDALRVGPVTGLYDECGATALVVGEDAAIASFAPDSWYVVERREHGKAAAVAVATSLRRELRAGATLVDVAELDEGVVFTLAGADGARTLVVGRDARGRVESLEVRRSPAWAERGTYAAGASLARSLGKGGAVRAISFASTDDGASVVLDMTRGRDIIIDYADLASTGECGC